MSQKPGSKSLADQQKDFKRALLSSSAVTQSIAEARAVATSTSTTKNYAYEHLTATASAGDLHINSYLFSIISFLREKDRDVSLDEIKQFLRIDIAASAELLKAVSNNERIICSLPFLRYKPLHNIRSKAELLEFVRNNATIHGFDINSIKEVFPKVNVAVQELMAAKQVLGLGPKEDSINILFYNDLVLPVYPDAEVKKLWHGQLIPDEHDLQIQLEAAGLKGIEVIKDKPVKSTNQSNTKRPSSNRNRRIKMTNTHLTEFNFNEDYPG